MTLATVTTDNDQTSQPTSRFEERYNKRLYHKRRLINRLGLGFAISAIAFGLFWLTWILLTLFVEGFQGLIEMPVFMADTPPPMGDGGLRNAIIGSLMIALLGLAIGTPVGMMAGIYLAEFSQGSLLGKVTRFLNDILLSAPSIVIGLFVYALMVKGQSFSGWAGAVALALIVIPIVVRTTENMLNLVPNTLREAAYALGTPKWKLISTVTLKAAKAGLTTGVLLAFARITGETAPLLFTALNNQYFSTDMSQPMANLPNTIYQFAMSPYDNWHALAWAAALLITMTVLIVNILARFIGGKDHTR
ncbi:MULTISPECIES: phosphate ABC transporter permease PstA [Psychrobacter]|uniref:Phosphate transport system permease protein PstA n=1 Tax=Psychrobacter cryohalolentis (strain ATCC BAA-1226 / DSM 17306 / VKM B-2378 / K5) TaxID=335284 RepID=Q1Q8K5_PSYCK|nr:MULTISPECIES: phosphate ABC transporter permease PstA [Psychrobacter]ABE75998.1 phosphate ABC transporter membrane protein 2, PhoT family [Psychrobacter cryohalolentis K5]AGP49868.1 phosphate transporter permease subunit PtsA [Psychrobacter sp. G]ASE26179.1 phosphate ABC transporter permease PtsA [Psychrobacter cryohalolentis]WAI86844.1 Phosphate transport system permease protein PstA [Psychrobacter sp. SC65A.3]